MIHKATNPTTPRDVVAAVLDTWDITGSEADELTDKLISALAGHLNEWRPIESAPKDGTWILAYHPDGHYRRISWGKNRVGEVCWCSVDYYWHEAERAFTHWQPLPKPPGDAS